jgi:glycosyltransferase involved in cell wall biosynthesis
MDVRGAATHEHRPANRPTVVHSFLFHSYVLTAFCARLAGIKVTVAGRRSLGEFRDGHPLARMAERVATAITDSLIANAQAVAEVVHHDERVAHEKITVIYNGLPPEAFAAAEPLAIPTHRPVLACVANLKAYKGHRYLVEAMALLRDRGHPCTLVAAGEGPQRQSLEDLASQLAVDLRLLGSRTDVNRLMAAADIAVLPSLTEGMSNAVMEAMAAGRPIVATSVGGTPELIGTDRGLLVPPADAVALADAIERLLLDRELAATLGAAARDWAATHLSLDTMIENHISAYLELVRRSCVA